MRYVDGRWGWVLVIGMIAFWEVLAVQGKAASLTYAFRRGWEGSPITKFILAALCLFFLAHLFMPVSWRQYDPIDRYFDSLVGR